MKDDAKYLSKINPLNIVRRSFRIETLVGRQGSIISRTVFDQLTFHWLLKFDMCMKQACCSLLPSHNCDNLRRVIWKEFSVATMGQSGGKKAVNVATRLKPNHDKNDKTLRDGFSASSRQVVPT